MGHSVLRELRRERPDALWGADPGFIDVLQLPREVHVAGTRGMRVEVDKTHSLIGNIRDCIDFVTTRYGPYHPSDKCLTALAAAHSYGRLRVPITRSVGRWAVALAITAVFVSGCATPVGVSRLDVQTADRTLNANVLSSDKPSAYSTQILERTALSRRYQEEPEAVLAELNSGLGKPHEHDRLFALCELSFAYAEKSQDQSYYLAAAVYAYAFLFPADPADAPGPYDPRLRLAVDLYDRGIALGLATEDGTEVDLSERQLSLPFGSLNLAVNPAGFDYGGNHLRKFASLADLKVRGLRNTYRRAGIGAALSAGVEPAPNNPASRWIPPTAKVPITVFVRFDDPRRAMSDGYLHGTVELYDVDKTAAVQIGSYSVPLESDSSAALAYRLEGAPVWDFEFAGFRRGDYSVLGVGKSGDSSGLYMLHPYHPNTIPVVLVHGTASSPARWAEMANELLGDPEIASRYQIWVFIITAEIRSRCLPCACGNRSRHSARTPIPKARTLNSIGWSSSATARGVF